MCRELGVSEQTYPRWRNQFGGLKADDAKRLKDLERELDAQAPLADAELEKAALKAIARKLVIPDRRDRAVQVLGERFGCTQRRVCPVVGESCSSQRRGPAPVGEVEKARGSLSRCRALLCEPLQTRAALNRCRIRPMP